MRNIKKHIIHCSDSTFGDATIIREWHTMQPPKGNGWSDIGYHIVILRDGTIDAGRPLQIAGAHCYGHNSDSVGTCLIGKDTFTEEQFTTLRHVAAMLEIMFPDVKHYGHKDFNMDKTCPNFDVEAIL